MRFGGISLFLNLVEFKLGQSISPLHSPYVRTRVVPRFGISVRYRSVFSRYFSNRYRRKTRSGGFGIVHLAGTPFCPLFDGSSPPFEGKISSRRIYKTEFLQNFTKWSSRQILQYKKYRTEYRPASAGTLNYRYEFKPYYDLLENFWGFCTDPT
jgi:hypothetical protein